MATPQNRRPNQKSTFRDRYGDRGAYVSDQQLAVRYDVHRSTIWRWPQSRGFPQPVRLSPQCTRWRLEDVVAWEQRQCAHPADADPHQHITA